MEEKVIDISKKNQVDDVCLVRNGSEDWIFRDESIGTLG